MKATDLLKQHHRELEQLFIDLLSVTDAQERKNVREELALKLVAHATIERELFYAELERTDTLAEAYEEHAIIDWGLQRLLVADLRMDSFRAKTTVIKQIVEHHMSEEEDTLLPQAERTFGSAMLDELGQRMTRRYDQIVEELGYEALLAQALGVPKGQLRKAHPVQTAQRAATKRAASATKTRRAPAAKKRATTTATKKRSVPASKKRAAPKRAATPKRAAPKRAAPKRAAPKRTHAAPTRRTTKAVGVKKSAKGSARGRKTS